MDSTQPSKESKLLEILNYYRPIEVLHSTVQDMCNSDVFKKHFQKVLQHDLEVLQQRSQELNDHEISSMQKAFVVLMEDGDHIAGIELYVEEIVGLKMVEDTDKLQILKLSAKTRDLLMDKVQSDQLPESPTLQGFALARQANAQGQISEELFVSDGSEDKNPQEQQYPSIELDAPKDVFVINRHGDPALKNPDEDNKFERLWNLYKTADNEYRRAQKNTHLRTQAAKFLRDTTENCILYVEAEQRARHSQLYDELKLRELHTTLKEAIKEAEKGSGGKRRRFADILVPTAPRQMRGDHSKGPLQNPNPNQKPPTRITRPFRGSYGGPRTPMRRYPDQRQSIGRRRSASPRRYSDAPRQLSVSEQYRDRRREDLLPGYDTYRPRY